MSYVRACRRSLKGSRMQRFSIGRRLSRRWTPLVATTTQPAVFVNDAAQGDSNSIGCRIKIDNAVKDERSVTP